MFKKVFTISLILFLILVNPAFAANTKSIALDYDSSQYLSISTASATGLDFTTTFTIEAWVNFPDDYESFNPGICSYNDREYAFRILSDGRLGLVWIDSTNTERTYYVASGYTEGDWAHMAVTYDADNDEIKVYLNGSQVGSTGTSNVTTLGTFSVGNDEFHIGTVFNGGARNFDGKIDEFIMWNDVRTSSEISASYNSGNGKEYAGNESGMVAYWRFEDDLLDETSNDNDLTNNNSATFSTDVPWSGSTPPATKPRKVQSEFWF